MVDKEIARNRLIFGTRGENTTKSLAEVVAAHLDGEETALEQMSRASSQWIGAVAQAHHLLASKMRVLKHHIRHCLGREPPDGRMVGWTLCLAARGVLQRTLLQMWAGRRCCTHRGTLASTSLFLFYFVFVFSYCVLFLTIAEARCLSVDHERNQTVEPVGHCGQRDSDSSAVTRQLFALFEQN